MPVALGPRFVLEAGFLILLAVVVGFADLRPALIILVMAVAWLLVSLVEYFAWRQGPRLAPMRRFGPGEPTPAGVLEDVVEEAPPPPPPPPLPPEPDEETIISPPSAEPAEPEQAAEPFPETERRMRHRLEPLQPRPRRRWILFGSHERPGEGAEGEGEEGQ